MKNSKPRETKYGLSHSMRHRIKPLTLAVSSALTAGSLQAATITVTTLADGFVDDECTLREAIYSATYANGEFNDCEAGDVGSDQIVFESSLTGTVQLVPGASYFDYGADDSSLVIGDSLEIDGDDRITVRGTGGSRAVNVKYRSDLGFEPNEVIFSNITISNGGGDDRGGAIYSNAKFLTLNSVTLEDNEANNAGGAVFHAPQDGFYSSLRVFDSEISYNEIRSSGSGGGIYFSGNNSAVDIYNSTFIDNSSREGHGGAIYLKDEDRLFAQIEQSYFGYNAAEISGNGGALAIIGNELSASIENNQHFYNSAANHGGALFINDGLIDSSINSTVRLRSDGFFYNMAGNSGGGAFIQLTDASFPSAPPFDQTIAFHGNVFQNNSATVLGGGVYIASGLFTSLQWTDGNEMQSNTGQYGGGGALIVLQQSEASFANLDSSLNLSPQGPGGGLYLISDDSAITVDGFTSNRDRAEMDGGGLSLNLNTSQITIANSLMDQNRSGRCGAGAAISTYGNSSIDVRSSRFTNSVADDCGGAISLLSYSKQGPNLTIQYSAINDNQVVGGAISSYRGGGGVSARLSGPGNLQIMNSTLSGNYSYAPGGAVRLDGEVNAFIAYATIALNEAYYSGGGIRANSMGCYVSNSLFADNVGSLGFGGLNQDLTGSQPCDVRWSLVSSASNSIFNDLGNNIRDQSAQIDILRDNGGTGGETHALLPNSPAIDAGSMGMGPIYDQRGAGFARTLGGRPDIGAYELRPDLLFQDRFEPSP